MTRARLVPVLLASAVLVGAANLGAVAATGGPLLLGKGNTASKTTKLKTTGNGAALALTSKKGKAPLKVSSSTKVSKLNADLVDGLDSAALTSKTYVYDLRTTGTTQPLVVFELPGLPSGQYSAQYAIAAGTSGASGFGCFLINGSLSAPGFLLSLGVVSSTIGGDFWLFSGGGYVDARTRAYRLVCQRESGTVTTIPASPQYTASIAFTRLDNVVRSGSTGTGTTAPRGVFR